MWISPALAANETIENTDPPSMGDAFLYNAGFIFLVVIMFYLIFIRPQQKRMSAQAAMLNTLKKGDKVITAGGLVGTIHKAMDGEREVQIDLGDKHIVTAMRSYLERADQSLHAPLKEDNDKKENEVKEDKENKEKSPKKKK